MEDDSVAMLPWIPVSQRPPRSGFALVRYTLVVKGVRKPGSYEVAWAEMIRLSRTCYRRRDHLFREVCQTSVAKKVR
jgi:hypothetical protein